MISLKIINPGAKYKHQSDFYRAVITVGGMEIDCADWNYSEHYPHTCHYDYERVLEWCEKLVKEFAKNGIDIEHSGIYNYA